MWPIVKRIFPPETMNKDRWRYLAGKTGYVLKGHVLNWPWLSRDRRRDIRYRNAARWAEWYLRKYHPFISALRHEETPQVSDEKERIFTIWQQGEDTAPEIVKSCIASMRRRSGMEVVVIDENNLSDWIRLPDEIMKKWRQGKIRGAHFSDICRVELLYQHGGIWLDATGYVTSPVPDEILREDFFIYMAGKTVRFNYSFVQNCFFRAKKHNPLLGLWRDAIFEYWINEDTPFDYSIHQLLFKTLVETNDEARRLFEAMPHVDQDPTHELWFKYSHKPFSEEIYRKAVKDTFFQKTTYKSSDAICPVKDTVADYIINARIPDTL